MIELSKNFLLGEGGERFVYIHPEDNSKVIKVILFIQIYIYNTSYTLLYFIKKWTIKE